MATGIFNRFQRNGQGRVRRGNGGQGNMGQGNAISGLSPFPCPPFLCPFPSPRRRFRATIAGRTAQERAAMRTVRCTRAVSLRQRVRRGRSRIRRAGSATSEFKNPLADKSGQTARRCELNGPGGWTVPLAPIGSATPLHRLVRSLLVLTEPRSHGEGLITRRKRCA